MAAVSAELATDEQPEPLVFDTVTPSGIEVRYSPAPRRYYAVRDGNYAKNDPDDPGPGPWVEVPSVTTVLGCLEKPGLAWWGQGIAIEGVIELISRGLLVWVDA